MQEGLSAGTSAAAAVCTVWTGLSDAVGGAVGVLCAVGGHTPHTVHCTLFQCTMYCEMFERKAQWPDRVCTVSRIQCYVAVVLWYYGTVVLIVCVVRCISLHSIKHAVLIVILGFSSFMALFAPCVTWHSKLQDEGGRAGHH
jgi:hypothetical protein